MINCAWIEEVVGWGPLEEGWGRDAPAVTY